MIKQGAHDYSDEFGDYCHKLINLMPWIGMHITKGINHGSVMPMVKCTTQPITIEGGCFPGKMMDDRLKPYTGGATN